MFRTSLLTVAISATCISAAAAATIDFHATMNSKSEVPPTNSTGSGDVQATLNTDTKQLNYTMTYTGLTGSATPPTSMARQQPARTPAWRCRSGRIRQVRPKAQ
jgi:hypothetical protein